MNPLETNIGTFYICGPITNLPNLNKEEFTRFEKLLTDKGFKCINPHKLFENINTDGFEHKDYMKVCASYLAMCDSVITLEGWNNSIGATMEVDISRILKKTIYLGEAFIKTEIFKKGRL